MKRYSFWSFISIIFNLCLIGLCVAAVGSVAIEDVSKTLANPIFYSRLPFVNAVVTLIASIVILPSYFNSFKEKKDKVNQFGYSLRLISATLSGVIILVNLFYYIIIKKIQFGAADALITENLFFRILIPGLSIVSFLIVEIEPKLHFKKSFIPLTVIFGYGFIILLIAFIFVKTGNTGTAQNFIDDYYFFDVLPELLKEQGEELVKNIIALCLIFVGTYVTSLAFWCVNRIFSSIFIGYEYVEENAEDKNEVIIINEKELKDLSKEIYEEENSLNSNAEPVQQEVKEVKEVKEKTKKTTSKSTGKKKTAAQPAKKAFEPKFDSSRVYHISYHDRRLKTWKVKLENSKRALKILPTQKEAIDFAKALIKNYGGSIRVHSTFGRIRKD